MNAIELINNQDIISNISLHSILQDFYELSIGEELTLDFNYEPVEILQQFEQNFNGEFIWLNRKTGPNNWYVSVVKCEKDLMTVGEILTESPKAFKVFRRYDIDVCFEGNLLFTDACKKAGISRNEMLDEIEEANENIENNIRVDEWPLDFLIDYIVMNHHNFEREKAKFILNILRELQSEDEIINPWIFDLNLVIINLQNALKRHLKYEEDFIFPAIKKLFVSGVPPQKLPFETLKISIEKLKEDDVEMTTALRDIRNMIKNFDHKKAGKNLQILFRELDIFEEDLHYHLHLEFNVLFPKAIFLEEEAYIWND